MSAVRHSFLRWYGEGKEVCSRFWTIFAEAETGITRAFGIGGRVVPTANVAIIHPGLARARPVNWHIQLST